MHPELRMDSDILNSRQTDFLNLFCWVLKDIDISIINLDCLIISL